MANVSRVCNEKMEGSEELFNFGFENGNFFDAPIAGEYSKEIEADINECKDHVTDDNRSETKFKISRIRNDENNACDNEDENSSPADNKTLDDVSDNRFVSISKEITPKRADLAQSPPPRSFDVGIGNVFRLSSWIRQDGGNSINATQMSPVKMDVPGPSRNSVSYARRDADAADFCPGSSILEAKRRKTTLNDWDVGTAENKPPPVSKGTLHDYFQTTSEEYERRLAKNHDRSEIRVEDYKEVKPPPPRSHGQSIYKAAVQPAHVLTEMYGKSNRSLGGVIRQNFKIPVGEAAIVRRSPMKAPVEQNTNVIESQQASTSSTFISASKDLLRNNMDPHLVAIIEREILQLKSDISWDDLVGLTEEKATIKELIVWPLLRPDLFKGIRALPKGLLLYGPPGTGKTLIGRCIASQAKATFFNVSASSLTSKWMGESEKLVRTLFEVARLRTPAVIFIDEVDSLMSHRLENENDSTRRMKNEFLQQLDGAKSDADEQILLIGATNRPHELDAAARRRFARRIYVPLPDGEARGQIISRLLFDQNHQLSKEQIQLLADRTNDYSCADVTNLCKEAALGPLRSLDSIETISLDEIPPITFEHFEKALNTVRASVSENEITLLKSFHDTFGYNS